LTAPGERRNRSIMSRIIFALLILVSAFLLSACGRKAPLDTPPPPGNQDQSFTR